MSGVMQKIRQLLANGESAQALIQRGYKAGSVFKVQWQMRKKGEVNGKGPHGSVGPGPNGVSTGGPGLEQEGHGPERVATLEAENADLNTEVARLRQQAEEGASFRSELDHLQQEVEHLTHELSRFRGESSQQVSDGAALTEALKQQNLGAERRLESLEELAGALTVMVLHVDGHQRSERMNTMSFMDLAKPGWTVWRREQAYEQAREKLLRFLDTASDSSRLPSKLSWAKHPRSGHPCRGTARR